MKLHTPAVQYANAFRQSIFENQELLPTFYDQEISFAGHDGELVRQLVLLVVVNCAFELLPHVRVLNFGFRTLIFSQVTSRHCQLASATCQLKTASETGFLAQNLDRLLDRDFRADFQT